MDDINNLVVRATACVYDARKTKLKGDTFYLNGDLPSFTSAEPDTKTTAVTERGVFAVFSGIAQEKKSVAKVIDDFAESIVNCGKAAVDACIGQFSEELGNTEFSFAMIRIKNDVGQIFYSGSNRVYIYRGGKVVNLTGSLKDKEKDSDSEIRFTPEFKLLENDVLMLCTDGVFEVLDIPEFKQIFDNTSTSKGAARSVVFSAKENDCSCDATSLVLRLKKEMNVGKRITTNIPSRDSLETDKKEHSQQDELHKSATFVVASNNEDDSVNTSVNIDEEIAAEDISRGDNGREYLGMSLASWIVVETLTVALGVILGLIVLMFT